MNELVHKVNFITKITDILKHKLYQKTFLSKWLTRTINLSHFPPTANPFHPKKSSFLLQTFFQTSKNYKEHKVTKINPRKSDKHHKLQFRHLHPSFAESWAALIGIICQSIYLQLVDVMDQNSFLSAGDKGHIFTVSEESLLDGTAVSCFLFCFWWVKERIWHLFWLYNYYSFKRQLCRISGILVAENWHFKHAQLTFVVIVPIREVLQNRR